MIDQIKDHYLFHVIYADLLNSVGQVSGAVLALQAGIAKVGNSLEKRLYGEEVGQDH